MEFKLTEEDIFKIAKMFGMNMAVNEYAIERVAFGYEKPGDPVPLELYLEHLHFDLDDLPHGRGDIPGVYIDTQERINTEFDYDGYVFELFVYKMQDIFGEAQPDPRIEDGDVELPYIPRIRDYIFGILPLFKEILKVDVEYAHFDIIPISKLTLVTERRKWKKFAADILIEPLFAGDRIDCYIEEFTNMPYYVQRLIEKRDDGYYLKPIDADGYEYPFALFSLMNFYNNDNKELFELKMREWERLRSK